MNWRRFAVVHVSGDAAPSGHDWFRRAPIIPVRHFRLLPKDLPGIRDHQQLSMAQLHAGDGLCELLELVLALAWPHGAEGDSRNNDVRRTLVPRRHGISTPPRNFSGCSRK
jgi:hypothetical protein